MSARPTVAAIVAEARLWLGTPYQHQASCRGFGCDCLGLVRGVWRGVIGAEPETVPPYTSDWAEAGGLESLKDAGMRHFVPIAPASRQGGDVLLFRLRDQVPAKHLAIMVDGTSMIHAHDGACVAQVPLSPWWQRRLAYVFRFPGVDA